MLYVDEKNIWGYITEKIPSLKGCKFKSARMLDSKGDQSIGDGFLNYVYRVRFFCGERERSVVVKQARKKSRLISVDLPPQRIAVEHDALKIRRSIMEASIPQVLYFDSENYVLILEDLNYMKCLRYALSSGHIYDNLYRKIGEFLGYNHFFTSEYYLDSQTFLSLRNRFRNAEMRALLADAVFVVGNLESAEGERKKQNERKTTQERLSRAVYILTSDEGFREDCNTLKKIYEQKSQCLIHGDLHTSNIFVDSENTKYIDMEETIMGPAGFDLGYFIGNLVSQFCAAPYKNGTRNTKYMNYIKNSIEGVFNIYFETFENLIREYGVNDENNKVEFGEKERREILAESIGFCATSMISRVTSMVDFPEFDEIKNLYQQEESKILALLIGCRGLRHRKEYDAIETFTEDMIGITNDFVCKRY